MKNIQSDEHDKATPLISYVCDYEAGKYFSKPSLDKEKILSM